MISNFKLKHRYLYIFQDVKINVFSGYLYQQKTSSKLFFVKIFSTNKEHQNPQQWIPRLRSNINSIQCNSLDLYKLTTQCDICVRAEPFNI